jgi:two-component SAPR family response regulator
MYRYLLLIIIFVVASADSIAQSYGLAFNSHEVVQEKRTSLDLSPGDSLCFDKDLTLEFDLNFVSNRDVYFGYILRIINNDQNVDIICSQQEFKIVTGRQLTNIVFTIQWESLFNNWHNFRLQLQKEKKQLAFFLNGKEVGTCPLNLTGNCYRFLWGANDDHHYITRDIPPMRIRNIKLLQQEQLKYEWALADTGGVNSVDQVSGRKAQVKNPVWIKPGHQRWNLEKTFTTKGLAAVAFDQKNDRLYITGSDTVWTYDPANGVNGWSSVAHPSTNLLYGNQAIFDTVSGRLYDFYIDAKEVITFDSVAKTWSNRYKDTLLTEWWHANKFASPKDSSIYIIGGYGQLKYKNIVQRYHIPTRRWEEVPVTGEHFPPRYLAALGLSTTGDTAFIMGGYGSPTGDQMLNPGNYYDLYAFDIRRRSFKKMHTITTGDPHYLFANSLIVDPSGKNYYALIFPNGSFNTQLQLIHGTVSDSTYRLVGDKIPYSFYDVQTYADLFYSPVSKKLFAVTMHFSPEAEKLKNTAVKIYSIDFPPETIESAVAVVEAPHSINWWWTLLLIIPAIGVVVLVRRMQIKSAKISPVVAPVTEVVPANHPPSSSISLFGQFMVLDNRNKEITKLFTPLLKELFLVILIYTIKNKKGISSEALKDLLWHDKPDKDAKNNRSVNLAKLKPILEQIGNCGINKEETGAWHFHWPTEAENGLVYIDYYAFMNLVQGSGRTDRHFMKHLLSIVSRGTFLQQTEYNWLDDIKAEVSGALLDRCQEYIDNTNMMADPEFIIEVANAMLLFDRLNENALIYKCRCLILLKRHALANNTYLSFAKEYKEIYGEDFPKSFNEIIK